MFTSRSIAAFKKTQNKTAAEKNLRRRNSISANCQLPIRQLIHEIPNRSPNFRNTETQTLPEGSRAGTHRPSQERQFRI